MKSIVAAACVMIALTLPATAAAQATDRVTVEETLPDPVDAALADDEGAVAGASGGPGDQSILSYTPDYFAPYNPSNAYDMVSRVPGFSTNTGGNARGFGQNAGNVLINGERPSAKAQDESEILRRIPVGEVVRIDLIRGQVAGFDMGGRNVVVNVIRRVGDRASGAWRIQSMYNAISGDVSNMGEISGTFSVLGANVSAGLELEGEAHAQFRREYVFDPSGAPLQYNEERYEGGPKGWTATFSADRAFGEWTLRLNGRYGDTGFSNRDLWRRMGGFGQPAHGPTVDFLRYDFEHSASDSDETEWELGGDLERPLSSELTLKIIAVQNRTEETSINQRAVYHDVAGLVGASSNGTETETGESIVRSFATWTPRAELSFELGAEGAFNFLESTDIVTDGSSSTSQTRVEEKRAEPFVSGLWRVRPGLTLDAAFQAEFSKISQSGFANRSRDFFYPKGHASVTWDARPSTQVRVTAERNVGQLRFFDFQRSIDLEEGTADAGNPDLVPAQNWRLAGVVEQRFWEDGVLSVEYSRSWIEDAEGQIPLPGSREAPGNIGDADRWSIEISVDAPLDRVGIPNARLEASYEYLHSEVVDPVTGQIRDWMIAGCFFCGSERSIDVEFRKDHPEAGFSWGVEYGHYDGGEAYRLTEITANANNHGGFDAFVETTRFFGVTMRLAGGQLGNFYSDRYRYRFFGPRNIASLGAVEQRRQIEDFFLDFRVIGNF